MSNTSRIAALFALFGLVLAGSSSAVEYQIGVREDGVYRLTYEQLAEAGFEASVSGDRLRLRHRDEDVTLWVNDGQDGAFGPGDALEFVGTHPAGRDSYYSEHTRWNVYRLSIDESTDVEKPAPASAANARQGGANQRATPIVSHHLEQDAVRVRFNGRLQPDSEIWFWKRLSVLDRKPFSVRLPKATLKAPDGSIRMRIGLKGWSTPRVADAPDHRVEALIDGEVVGAAEWDGQDDAVIELDDISWRGDSSLLELRIPKREIPGGTGEIVDVALLNFIELEHGFDGVLRKQQIAMRINEPGTIRFRGRPKGFAYGSRDRVPLEATTALEGGDWWIVREDGFLEPEWARRDEPSTLAATAQQADYLMIAHRNFLEASEPLAELHRERGLNVSLIDVQDIYDEFNHGIVDPVAIRDFVAHAYQHWERPAPRFVLLVGDASWDSSSDQPDDRSYADWTFQSRESRRPNFLKNSSTEYDDTRFRNLIPAWSAHTYEGYAASDNGFVTVAGDDIKPDLAIGRLPVATSDEVAAIVAKITAYVGESEIGPWRRNTLWITNEEAMFQRSTESLIESTLPAGFDTRTIFPRPEEADNAMHQASIIEAFDAGNALVHFVGHGGRYIWRTGPPDPRKNHDLFTLDHLEQLRPTTHLPVILSMTCYSAPFDHPTADSIGEKFLRLPNRGAIAVIAASWRNFPAASFSRAIVSELMKESTIGEALMEAKRVTSDRLLVETYNLLGDPAISMNLPRGELLLTALSNQVVGIVKTGPASGKAVVEYLDVDGNVLAEREVDLRNGRFELTTPAELNGTAVSARAYVWNGDEGFDAVAEATFSG